MPTGSKPPGSVPDDIYIEEDIQELDLDEEPARARSAARPAPALAAPSVEERRELARQLAEKARADAARKAGMSGTDPGRRFAAETTSPGNRLADLARRAPSRPKSAAEVLEEARRAEQDAKDAQRRAQLEREEAARRAADDQRRRARAEEARREAEEAKREAERRARQERDRRDADEAAELAAMERATFGRHTPMPPTRGPARSVPPPPPRPSFANVDPLVLEERLTEVLEGMVQGLEVADVYLDVPAAVVGPLWKSHAVRARHDKDLATAIAADAVTEVLERRPHEVAVARVKFGGKEWAVWCDTSRSAVLACLTPADLYLVGIA